MNSHSPQIPKTLGGPNYNLGLLILSGSIGAFLKLSKKEPTNIWLARGILCVSQTNTCAIKVNDIKQ